MMTRTYGADWADDAAVLDDDDDAPHLGHWSLFGTWWCDTCDSPYCEQS